METNPKKKIAPAIGIYIHIPFCSKICPFCSFTVFRNDVNRHALFTQALIAEMTRFAKTEYLRQPVTSIYIGGGTPSLLPIHFISSIINTATRLFNLRDTLAVSFECNPEWLDLSYLRELKTLGVNRLSLGIQSFDDRILNKLGRAHDANDGRRAISNAKRAGFDDINLDFMYGTPFQSVRETVNQATLFIEHEPKHISAYGLTIERGTAFFKRSDYVGWIHENDSLIATAFGAVVDTFAEINLQCYEVSNFAVSGYESRQNLIYWNRLDYMGFGPGAHSKIGDLRRHNSGNLRVWQKRVLSEEHPPYEEEKLTIENIRDEWIMIGLRTREGLNFENIAASISPDDFLKLSTVRRLIRLKKADAGKSTFRLRRSAFMLADALAVDIATEIDRATHG